MLAKQNAWQENSWPVGLFPSLTLAIKVAAGWSGEIGNWRVGNPPTLFQSFAIALNLARFTILANLHGQRK